MEDEQIGIAADDGIRMGGQSQRQELGVTRVAAWWVEGGGIRVGHGEEETIASKTLHENVAPLSLGIAIELRPVQHRLQFSKRLHTDTNLRELERFSKSEVGDRLGAQDGTDQRAGVKDNSLAHRSS